MILPPNSLSNVLTVRCNLAQESGPLARQHLTIVAVHDSLWTMQYAPPAELPVETKRRARAPRMHPGQVGQI